MKRALGLIFGLALLAPALGGCGFTPLYAEHGVTPGMAAIEVITPEGRIGHLLSEDLRDDLATDRSKPALYRLALAVDEKRYARGLTFEQVATWYELSLRVSYSLIDISTGKTLTTGVMPISVSYNAANDPYAGVVAQQNGQQRAAADAAQRIRLELATYFAGSPIKSPGTSAGS
jgi:LPS-assembly lipoprotein